MARSSKRGVIGSSFVWGVAAGIVLTIAALQVSRWASCRDRCCGMVSGGGTMASADLQQVRPGAVQYKLAIKSYLVSDYSGAVRNAEAALALDPGNPDYRNLLTQAKLKLKAKP